MTGGLSRDDRAREILRLSRRVAFLDTTRAAARQDLDEVAVLVVGLRGRPLPPSLAARLSLAVDRLSEVEARLEAMISRLETLAPTVPVRVWSSPRHNEPTGRNDLP